MGSSIIIDGTDNFHAKFLINDACVFGVMGGTIGTIQATEALKYILGIGELFDYEQSACNFRK